MAAHKTKITQAELTRYLKAYRDAGIPISRTEIGIDGKVSIFTSTEETPSSSNDWDQH